MRALLSVAELAAGGAERVVVELANGLEARGEAIAVAGDTGAFERLLDRSDVDRYVLPGRGRSPLTAARAIRRLRAAIGKFEPDLVHAHNVKATGIAAIARLGPGRMPPLLATFHGVRRDEYRRAAAILRLANAVACVSHDLLDGLARSGLPRERMRVIPNGVSLPAPLASTAREAIDRELGLDGRPVVSLVGRLVPQKAPQRFLHAAARVAASVPDARFLIVGDGGLRARMEELARRLGLAGQVRFTGVREDSRELISRSEILVFSSEWEGMPIAALEALAAEVPVVSTDVEGMRRLLDGGAGIVVPPAVEPLAKAIVELLAAPDEREHMGRLGRERIARDHSAPGMVDAYRRLYGELVAS